jgi:hypothetical protein
VKTNPWNFVNDTQNHWGGFLRFIDSGNIFRDDGEFPSAPSKKKTQEVKR